MKGNPSQSSSSMTRRWRVPALLMVLVMLLAACAQVRLPASVPDIASFTADPDAITAGESSTLSWEIKDADTVLLDGEEVALIGSREVSPDETQEYVLVATNRRGSSDASVTIRVRHPDSPPLIANFTAEPEEIDPGSTSVLSWHVVGAESISISPDLGEVPQAVGSRVVTPESTTRYALSASNSHGAVTATATVRVKTAGGNDGLPVIAAFTASPEAIDLGSSTTLSWVVEGADEITISPDLGTVGSESSETVSPGSTTTYTLRARNGNGNVSRSVTVHVREDLDGPPLVALFTVSPSVIAPGGTATLRWAVVGADSVSISPGIGSVSHDASTTVRPSADTTYTLTASNTGGQSQRSVTIRVRAGGTDPGDPDPGDPPPLTQPVITALVADPMTGPAPLHTTFYWVITDPDDQVSSISLDFGDGTGTTSTNPEGNAAHTYSSVGIYSVVLRATLVDGGSIRRSTTIAVSGTGGSGQEPVIGSFTVTPTNGRAPLNANFAFEVSGTGPLTCLLDFGDGAAPVVLDDCSSGNIGNTYTEPGQYGPVLVVSDGDGGVAVSTVTLTVRSSDDDGSGSLISSFTANPTSGEAPLDVDFSWTLSAPADAWLFFGDGTAPHTRSGAGNRSHTYIGEDTYLAVLLAVDADGNHDLRHEWITAGEGAGSIVSTAIVRSGSTLVALNQDERSLLGPLLGGLLGNDIGLDILDNSSLLTASVNLFSLLDAVVADIGASGPEAVLLGTVDLADILDAALGLVGGTAAAVPLQQLINALPADALPLELGQLLNVDPDNILALQEVDLSVLDLVTVLAQLFNSQNVLTTAQPIEIGLTGGPGEGLLALLGLDSAIGTDLSNGALARIWLQVVEPPVFTFARVDRLGPTQAGFRSAGVRMAVELTGIGVRVSLTGNADPSGLLGGLLSTLLGLVNSTGLGTTSTSVELNLTELSVFAEVGAFDGHVSAINLSQPNVTVNASGSLASLHLGAIDHAVFFDRSRTALPEADFGTIASVDVDVQADLLILLPLIRVNGTVEVLARANTSRAPAGDTQVNIAGPYPKTSVLSSADPGAMVSDLLGNLELELGAGLNELSLVGLNVGQVAGPLLGMVEGLLNSVLGLVDGATDLGATLPLDGLLTGLLGSDLFAALGLDLGKNEITVLELIKP